MFQTNWKGIFKISKNPPNQQKKWPPGYSTPILAKSEKSSKNAVFPSNWLFSWKNIILNDSKLEGWMFQRNWKGIFNISKNHIINKKNGLGGKVRIQRFRPKRKSPQNIPFFSNWLFWWKNKILKVSDELQGYFPHFKKFAKSQKKMATPDTAISAESEKSSKHAVFPSNWLFSWKIIVLNVSDELEGYFQPFKKSWNQQQKCPRR